jgi:aminoglycoside phosphotransferase (APT) family kinase protein
MPPRTTLDEHRILVQELFPTLDVRSFDRIGSGWTYDTYDVNDEWIVQIPRSTYAAERLVAQSTLLPGLAREVSALIPVPSMISSDPPAMVYPKLHGVPADRAPEGFWPERLGRFLYDLHMVPPEFVGLRAQPPEVVRGQIREEIASLAGVVVPRLDPGEAFRAEAMIDAYVNDDRLWTFAPCLTHGDLGPEHVLVGPSGDLIGVLDWEESAIGDPVWDFAWWIHEMPSEGERALAAYGGTPDATFRERARIVWALMPWHEVRYGADEGLDRFVDSGLRGVRARLP